MIQETEDKRLAPFYNYSLERGYYKPTLEEFNKTRTDNGLEPVISFDDPKGKAKPFSLEKQTMFGSIVDYLLSERRENDFYSRGDWSHPEITSGIHHDILDALNIQIKEDFIYENE